MSVTPAYMSAAQVARKLNLTRSAVYNAVNRGSIRPAAYVDNVPVYDDRSVAEWRANLYSPKTPCRAAAIAEGAK